MLRRIPTPASRTTSDDPPYERNGSGITVRGALPITAKMLIAACPQTSTVSPVASRFPNGSLQRIAMSNPA